MHRDSLDDHYGLDSKMEGNSVDSKAFKTITQEFDSQTLLNQRKNFRSLEPMSHVSKNQIPNLIKKIDEKREKMYLKNKLLLSNNFQSQPMFPIQDLSQG